MRARKAIQHAAELSRTSPDPALKLPIAIQTARLEDAAAEKAGNHAGVAGSIQALRSAIASAKTLGYH